jgi:hypothetical protein
MRTAKFIWRQWRDRCVCRDLDAAVYAIQVAITLGLALRGIRAYHIHYNIAAILG